MTRHVSEAEWQVALAAHREDEKALTKQMDALAAKRRFLPRMEVTKDYCFRTGYGEIGLADLFDGRSQLILYHHMLKPSDPAPCAGCSMVGDQIAHRGHLNARDTSFAMVSQAPVAEIETFRARMGWTFPWVESLDGFSEDFGVTSGFGVNVFLTEDSRIWRTYFTSGRGVETLGPVWSLLDITPYGRQETWQDAPEDVPQSAPYRWWRLHDEYGEDQE